MIITVKDWTAGDWVELEVDGKVYHQGHSVPDHVWIELLQKAGVTVNEEDVEPEKCGCGGCGG